MQGGLFLLLHDLSAVADDDALIGLVDALACKIVSGVVSVDRCGPDTLDSRGIGLLHDGEIACLDVCLGDGGDIHHKDLGSTVGIAAYGLVSVMSGVSELVTPRLVGSR